VTRAPRTTITMMAATVVLLMASAPPASALTTVAIWHMNERSGKMIDASRFDNDGSLRNITRVTPGSNGSGRAYRFNGRDSRVITRTLRASTRTLRPSRSART